MFKIAGREAYFLTGASFLDIYIKFPATIIFSILSIIIINRTKKAIIKGNSKKAIKNILILPIYIGVVFLVSSLIYIFWVNRNRLQVEATYLDKHINSTKEAYAIDIEENIIEEAKTLESNLLIQSQGILKHIPVMNSEMVKINLNQEEEKENLPIYEYRNPYLIKLRGDIAYFAPREITRKKTNTVFEYTHGNFAKIISANKVDEKGQMLELDSSFENQIFEDRKIMEPRIYYGRTSNSSAIVKSKNGSEFDYQITPSKIKANSYKGSGGLNLNFLDRIIMTLKTGKPEGIYMGKFKEDTKLLFNREIIKRAESIIPELEYDKSPYLVVSDEGRLLWVIDAYTKTNRYPYSQKLKVPTEKRTLEEINYIRASATVLIDAYDGTMKYYITDDKDPLIINLNKIYKDVFRDFNTLSNTIKEQLRYPKRLYDIQSEMIRKYHTNSRDIFYSGEDIWEISTEKDKSQRIGEKTLEYSIYKNIDQENYDIGFVTAYLPHRRQNINSYLIGRTENGRPNLKIYSYSKNNNIPGISFIQNQIMQDKSIRHEIESINVIGTNIESYAQMIPINDSMIYIEHIYQVHLNKNNQRVLKKVIAANGSKVGIGNTLNSAITNLFSDLAINIDIHDPLNREILIETIIRVNDQLEKSFITKDLESAGRYTKRLNELIKQLQNLDQKNKK